MASLPATYAGRTALGFGKRVGGKPAEAIAAEMSARTAEQMFKVLGELKGGAMKLGQAMSIFEAALPEDIKHAHVVTAPKGRPRQPKRSGDIRQALTLVDQHHCSSVVLQRPGPDLLHARRHEHSRSVRIPSFLLNKV